MYPSKDNPYLGIFVKNIEKGLIERGIDISKRIVISAKNKPTILKLLDYAIFYFRIIINGIFGKYDLIYGHYVSHIAIPLLVVKIFRPEELVLNFHGSDIKNKTKANLLLQYFAKKISKKASIVIAPSNFFKNEILKFVNINKNKIYVSPSGGIDTIFFCNSEKKYSATPVIGFVSQLDKKKGWLIFLDALKILKKNNIAFKVIAIGSANQENIMLIDKYNLSEEVEYHGIIEHNALPKYYRKMNLFVFPTILEESLGLVGLEAMAGSIPVIASQVGGITDYLEHEKNGFYFDKENATQLATKIKYFLNLSEEKKKELGINAYKKAKEFEHKKILQELHCKLEELHSKKT